jgi:2-amino-4-ketopentanoate thiolase alpha subunit
MTGQTRCGFDDWVEVEAVLLETADRSKNLPTDTAAQPLRMWIKGFAQAEANVGEEVTVRTVTGRTVTGVLSAINPGYFHTFGKPIPELVHVGRDLRERLTAYRADAAPKGGA